MANIVVVFSGGLDSTTLLYHLRDAGHILLALSVNYGQRHLTQESAAADAVCREMGVERRCVDLTALACCFGHNALTDRSTSVPEGEYSDVTIPVTTVPNRNMVLLSVGLALAASLEFDGVAFGAHGGEHTNYPDCRSGFARAMDHVARECNDPSLCVLAPFVEWDKAGIVRREAELGVPFELTWSCYQGGDRHCGKCGTCLDRRSAFTTAGVEDPTRYA
jgi:7-cyano-7-deazaguanine synthase